MRLTSRSRTLKGELPPPIHSLIFFIRHPAVMPFRMPFAGDGEFFSPDSVLSHAYGALLPMFTTKEATVLRQRAGVQGDGDKLPLGG